MNKFYLSLAASAVALLSVSVVPAQAALQPFGAIAFCRANAAECAGGGSSSVKLNDELATLLKRVNSQVNRSIAYRSERIDEWKLNPRTGDCEDYAISKRSALIRAGVSPNALRIATTKTRRGEPHAVLIVRTSAGSYVLDNRTAAIRPLNESGYRIETMSTGSLTRWGRG